MSNKKYHVIFSGQILNGFDEYDVQKNLEPIFKDQVAHILKNAPIPIKQNISLDQAEAITKKMELLGAKCEISPSEEDEMTLCLESEESPLALETSSEVPDQNDHVVSYEKKPDTSHSSQRMICPSCGFEQAQNKDCINCGIIIDRYQDTTENTAETPSKKDILQEYLEEMSREQAPETEIEIEKQGTPWFLKMVTSLIILMLLSALGWSYHFFVCKKPWRQSAIESVSIEEINDEDLNENLSQLQSKKETIAALQKALERKKKFQSTSSFSQSEEQFKLKNIPIPLLRHYIGKYVWVTCDNDSVHQGTFSAIYTEQIILKKTGYNLTIPINISMIKTVEYDMSESDYDDDIVAAYQAFKRRTEETFQKISLSQLDIYKGKNLRIKLCNGQVYEGILSKNKPDAITLQNIVYGQLVSFVIRKNSIKHILY
jgi:small nuclear ribonucleoprotein (snRNP)-like protein